MHEEKFIPLSVPNLKGRELEYVTNAVKTEWVSTGGPYVTEFENAIAKYVGVSGAVACQNGTAGLHTALLVCGVTEEQEVIVPTLTFIAAVNPVKYIGAEPIFMDCDDSLCMDPVKLEKFCETECVFEDGKLIHISTGKYISCIVVVHVFGNMADMEKIKAIAEKYNLKIIEDATEALGTFYTDGAYKGKYAGTIGDVGVYSFNGNKIITTGGGGMIVSDNDELIKHAKHLTTQAKSDELNYVHDEIGYNYRMTNLQAALGLAQLEQLESFIKVKEENYNYYKNKLFDIKGVELLDVRQGIRSNHWFYALYCNETCGMNKDGLIEKLSKHNVQSRPIWGLIHEQKPYKESFAYQIDMAKDFWKHVVNVPCSTNLTISEIERVIKIISSDV